MPTLLSGLAAHPLPTASGMQSCSVRQVCALCHLATFVYVPLQATCLEGSPVKSGVGGAQAALTCRQLVYMYADKHGTCPQRD